MTPLEVAAALPGLAREVCPRDPLFRVSVEPVPPEVRVSRVVLTFSLASPLSHQPEDRAAEITAARFVRDLGLLAYFGSTAYAADPGRASDPYRSLLSAVDGLLVSAPWVTFEPGSPPALTVDVVGQMHDRLRRAGARDLVWAVGRDTYEETVGPATESCWWGGLATSQGAPSWQPILFSLPEGEVGRRLVLVAEPGSLIAYLGTPEVKVFSPRPPRRGVPPPAPLPASLSVPVALALPRRVEVVRGLPR